MAIPYGFKKMDDSNVRLVTAEIEVVQRIYQRYVDGASYEKFFMTDYETSVSGIYDCLPEYASVMWFFGQYNG